MVALYLDIETTSMKADLGMVVVIGVLGEGEAELIFSGNKRDERKALEWLKEKLENCDLIITWYGSGFDIPFLLTRAIHHGVDLSKLAEIPMLDLYQWAKANLLLNSYKMTSVARFLGIDEGTGDFAGPDVLTLFKLWERGESRASDMIVQHCREDLHVLKRVHERLKPTVVRSSAGPMPGPSEEE